MFLSTQTTATIIAIVFNIFAVTNILGLDTNLTVGELGTLIGSEETTAWTGRTIYSFKGIPYAEAPVGDLRFRPPVKITSWDGTLDATEYGSPCPQNALAGVPLSSVEEDCLTLNVHVPERENDDTTLPIILWIHGGVFMSGYAVSAQPHYLLEEDVILVVIQFRLGPLGLLCLQTDEVPGNVQFLDQIMAMQWVQDNIAYFGGDPDRVTLAGQSAGAGSVNLHQVSPLSEGLFHQAIIQSGSIYMPYVMDYDPLRTATRLGEVVGCYQTDTSELAACFKGLEVQAILDGFANYLSIYSVEGLQSIGGHRAVIQTAGTQRFLEEDPRTLIARGEYSQVPMIGGVTKHDGSFYILEYYLSTFLPLGLVNDIEYLQYNLTSFLIASMGVEDLWGGIAQTLNYAHFNEGDLGDFSAMYPGLVDICSVFLFKAGVFEMMQTNSRLQPSYLYTFGYFGSSLTSGTTGLPFETGVPHSGDISYLFPTLSEMSDADITVAKRMVSLWTSFAITGQPEADGKTWEPMTNAFGPYLIIEDQFYDGTNFLDEHTIALKEGMTAVYRSSAIVTNTPQLVTLLGTVSWSVLRRI